MKTEKNRVINQLKKLSLFLTLSKIKLKAGMREDLQKEYSNEHILKGIREGNSDVFLHLNETTFPVIENFILQNRGTKTHAKEIFQDALIVVFKKLLKGSITLDCKFSTYFIAICKIIWKFNHKNGNPVILNPVDVVDNKEEIEELYKESQEFKLYRKHFNRLKGKKQRILLASLSNKPYDELYEEFGYKSADVFKTEVARIKKWLIKNITTDPEFEKCSNGKHWKL